MLCRGMLSTWPEPKKQEQASKVSPILAVSCIADFYLGTGRSLDA
jgi:hypothetical protein